MVEIPCFGIEIIFVTVKEEESFLPANNFKASLTSFSRIKLRKKFTPGRRRINFIIFFKT